MMDANKLLSAETTEVGSNKKNFLNKQRKLIKTPYSSLLTSKQNILS